MRSTNDVLSLQACTDDNVNVQCTALQELNALRPKQNDHRFPDDIFKCILLNEMCCILMKNSLKFVSKCPIYDMMAWRRWGDKPSSEPTLTILLTHICITRPQWLNVVDDFVIKTLTVDWPMTYGRIGNYAVTIYCAFLFYRNDW